MNNLELYIIICISYIYIFYLIFIYKKKICFIFKKIYIFILIFIEYIMVEIFYFSNIHFFK